MKKFLNIVLIVNTLFIMVCADNPNPTVFVYPIVVYVIAGFFRYYHREFVEFLTKAQ